LPPTLFALYNMAMPLEIRRAAARDADAVREIVVRALRETNARDYPASVIDRLASTLPDKVASKLEEGRAFVAVLDGRVVGTGSLDGQTVSSVFVHPRYQRRGVGTKLMEAIEHAASVESVTPLALQSSITALAFYAKRSFNVVSEAIHGDERTIFMAKEIPARLDGPGGPGARRRAPEPLGPPGVLSRR
jgi:GNAT superfamily N-acetyltransferase